MKLKQLFASLMARFKLVSAVCCVWFACRARSREAGAPNPNSDTRSHLGQTSVRLLAGPQR